MKQNLTEFYKFDFKWTFQEITVGVNGKRQ